MSVASEALADKSQRWWHLASIQVAGGVISIPLISIGSEILSNGLTNALLSIFIGNFIVFLISCSFVLMAWKGRLNTVENAKSYIGKTPSRIFALFILVSMAGWVASHFFADIKLLKTYFISSKFNVGAVIGTAASLILLKGIKGLKILSLLTVIPLIILLGVIIALVEPWSKSHPLVVQENIFGLSGIALVISASISAAVDLPTFFRHSKSKLDSLIALVIIFFIVSIVQATGVFLLKLTIHEELMNLIARNDASSTLVACFLLISMLTSVCWNIYAASVGWESLFPVLKGKTEYAVIGLVLTILLNFTFLEYFLISILSYSDALIGGVAGILIYEFLFKEKNLISILLSKNEYIRNYVSWFAGSFFGIVIAYNLKLPKVDSIILSLLGSFFVSVLISKGRMIYSRFHK